MAHTGPWTLKDWNDLVDRVNHLAASPPGSCTPATPLLKRSTAPAKWRRLSDIDAMQKLLLKVCPDNVFTEIKPTWKQKKVDELEAAINKGWCNCAPCTPMTRRVSCGSHGPQNLIAAPDTYSCCGTMHEIDPCYICSGSMCTRYTATGDFYPCPDNSAAFATIDSTYTTAFNALTTYAANVNQCQILACKITTQQALIDSLCSELDGYISEYKSLGCAVPTPDNVTPCASVKSNIRRVGTSIQAEQVKLAALQVQFAPLSDLIPIKESECDAAAWANAVACSSLQVRFPSVDFNMNATMLGYIAGEKLEWGKWYNPNTDSQITDLFYMALEMPDIYCSTTCNTSNCSYSYVQNCFRWGSTRTFRGIRPSVSLFYTDSKREGEFSWGSRRLSPAGIPFSTPGQANQLLLELAYPYQTRTWQYRCEPNPFGFGCGSVGNCQWFPPQAPEDWYWRGGCNGPLLQPLPADEIKASGIIGGLFEAYYPSDKMGTDYTNEQVAFYKLYTDWYTTHPKYDNRHERYT